jgi:L,D-transpeptidase YcbB
MILRGLTRILAGALALSWLTALGSAAPLKPGGEAADAEAPAVQYTVYDRVTDENTVAMRTLLAEAVADHLIAKDDAEAITKFYADRAFAMAWVEDGKLTDRAKAAVERIKQADTDGLEPSDYALPWEKIGTYFAASPAALARADLLLSQAIVDYARDAYSGRLDPASVSSNFGYDVRRLAAADILGLVSASSGPAATLDAYNPPQKEYKDLREALAKARQGASEDSRPEVPDGPMLKAGMHDPRVVTIRQRLDVSADVAEPDLYDEELVSAVKDFQKSARLHVDGMIGKNTVAAMNRGPEDHVATIIANMERWRWMPRYLGNFYVRVNVPNFNLDIYRDGQVVHSTPIIVGKVTNQTPIFSDEMESIVVNPVWNVPASIARNEMLPRLRAGSGLAGYRVYANIRGRFQAVNPGSINWRTVNMSKIQIKQPPGSQNALGTVKFLFPNKYSVYLHDTPSKSLFSRDTRAFSHGCMRVQDPWDFAAALLANNDNIDVDKLHKMVGGGERWVKLDHSIPVHVTYFTAWVDDSGALQVRNDIYGHDKQVLSALGLT